MKYISIVLGLFLTLIGGLKILEQFFKAFNPGDAALGIIYFLTGAITYMFNVELLRDKKDECGECRRKR